MEEEEEEVKSPVKFIDKFADIKSKANPYMAGLSYVSDVGQAFGTPKFDYSAEDYSVEDAMAAGKSRAGAIGNAILPGIGGIFGLIGQRKARLKAENILGNRESKMNNLLDYQRKKMQDNQLLKQLEMDI